MTFLNWLISQRAARWWLSVSACLTVALASVVAQAASDEVGSLLLVPDRNSGAYSSKGASRNPIRVFATDAGIFELDTYSSPRVRFWQRAYPGKELVRQGLGETSYSVPSSSASSVLYFTGRDASGAGTTFKSAVGMAKHPTDPKFAVVCGGEWIESGLLKHCPSVQVYEYEETADSSGLLTSLDVSLAGEYSNLFGTRQSVERVVISNTTVVVTNNPVSYDGPYNRYAHVAWASEDGASAWIVTNWTAGTSSTKCDADPGAGSYKIEDWWVAEEGIMTTVYPAGTYSLVETNYMSVVSAATESSPPVFATSDRATSGKLLDHDPALEFGISTNLAWNSWADILKQYEAGVCWPVTTTRMFYEPDVSFDEVEVWETRDVTVTNANYLATATDVAFVGDAAIVVSITGDERLNGVSGLVFFDAADPSAEGLIFPVYGLPGVIGGIDVDQKTGDIYATVPSASAVYRISAPVSGDPSSWLSLSDRTPVYEAGTEEAAQVGGPSWSVAAGSPGVSSSSWGCLVSPSDVSVWSPSEWTADGSDSTILLVVENAAGNPGGRVVGFDLEGAPLFAAAPASGGELNRPQGVSGIDGTETLVVTDTMNGRSLLCSVDLKGLEGYDILSVSSSAPGEAFEFYESDTRSNVVSFVVSPSRADRSYTLSVADDPAGVVSLCESTVTIPGGETAGALSFFALDGVVDGGTNLLSEATLRISSDDDPSVATEFSVKIDNSPPMITNAVAVCHKYITLIGVRYFIDAFRARAVDVKADSGLTYLWWATTNVTWAANNLRWAVTNNDWAASAAADSWTALDEFTAPQNTTEGAIDAPIHLYVAKGRQVVRPTQSNGFSVDFPSVFPAAGNIYRYGVVVVLTVLDKDGGASVLTWPYCNDPTGEYRWVPSLDQYDPDDQEDPPIDPETPATYSAVFTEVSPTALSFTVTHESGTASTADTVSLHASSDLSASRSEWPEARRASPTVFNVGAHVVSDGEPQHSYSAVISSSDDSSDDTVFYVIQNP